MTAFNSAKGRKYRKILMRIWRNNFNFIDYSIHVSETKMEC